MSKEAYTANEAADALGVSSARVRQMVLDGTLPATKFGNVLMITGKAIEAARQRKTKPGPKPKAPAEKATKKKGKK